MISKTTQNKIDKIEKGADFAMYKDEEVTIVANNNDKAMVYHCDLQKAENAELETFEVNIRNLTKIK